MHGEAGEKEPALPGQRNDLPVVIKPQRLAQAGFGLTERPG